MESHRSIDFTSGYHPDQAASFRVEPSADGRSVRVEGLCPGCRGRTVTVWLTGIGSGQKGIFRGSAAKALARIPDRRRLVFCECNHAHANRPDAELFRGCGASWHVEAP
jgi:hypothetical protein